MSNSDDVLIPLANPEAIGLGVGRRTLGRKIKDPASGFPAAIRINGRLYVRRSELEAFKERLIAEGIRAAADGRPRLGREARRGV
jgi:hypothetical protein